MPKIKKRIENKNNLRLGRKKQLSVQLIYALLISINYYTSIISNQFTFSYTINGISLFSFYCYINIVC